MKDIYLEKEKVAGEKEKNSLRERLARSGEIQCEDD